MRVNKFSTIGGFCAWANQKKNEFFFVFLSVCTTFEPLALRYFRSIIQKKTVFSFVFYSLNRTFDLWSKVGCTSEPKINNSIYFVFLSVCTTFVGKKRDEQRTYS